MRAWSPNHRTAREFHFSPSFVAFFSVEMCVCVFNRNMINCCIIYLTVTKSILVLVCFFFFTFIMEIL